MRQELTTDSVSRYIEASADDLYAIVSDVTRQPEMSPEVVSCEWIKGATGPAVGARFKAINHAGRGPNWPNKPVVVAAHPGREFAFARTEALAGTVEWRYLFEPDGIGTRVRESYAVTRELTIVGWFIIDTLYGLKDRRADLRVGMVQTLDRLAEISERKPAVSIDSIETG
jgi:Polyketide cyclase / dehydrase and lipid transport